MGTIRHSLTAAGRSRVHGQRDLRGFADGDDRQMPTTEGIADVDLQLNAGSAANERMRSGTRRAPRPTRTRFVARSATRGPSVFVDLVGSSRHVGLVRSLGVVPASPERQFRVELGTSEWNEDESPRALALQGSHQALDDRDTAVLAHGSETVTDPTTPAPGCEAVRCELHALVRDEMLRGAA